MNDRLDNPRKIFVDFSLIAGMSAFGRVSGYLPVPFFPEIGDCISFDFHGSKLNVSQLAGFSGISKVESRILIAGRGIEDVIFGLESFTLETYEDAKKLMFCFETTYGLFVEPYEL